MFTLPAEILLEIWGYICCESVPVLSAAITISHVCSPWRILILQCSEFWTSIDLPVHPDWVAKLLARSKRASLHIAIAHIPVNALQSQVLLELLLEVLKEIPRIETLRINAPVTILDRVVSSMKNDAPRLRVFVLNAVDGPREVVRSLPAALFHERTASLTELGILHWPVASGFSLPRTFPRTLKRLQIRSPYECAPYLLDLLRCLAELPLVEFIQIHKRGVGESNLCRIDGPQADAVVSPSPVTLAHLHTLDVLAEPLYCKAVLSHFRLPALRLTHVVCFDRVDRLRDMLMSLVPLLANFGEVDTIWLSGSEGDTVTMRFEGPDGHDRKTLTVTYWQQPIPRDVWATIRLWDVVYDQVENVHTMHVCGPLPHALLHPMCVFTHGGLPHLRVLKLEGVPLHARDPWRAHHSLPSNVLDPLRTYLTIRCAMFGRFQELHLIDSGGPGLHDQFCDFADTVLVDGVEGSPYVDICRGLARLGLDDVD